ncbi:MAG: agmatine deiminase family protein [Lewinellaceae bacterium]|nr:agmatine deiminase family protein [Lewinellaceae bacterium]
MNTKLLSCFITAFISITSLSAQVFTTPPEIPVRTMAEWEELQALVITWNPGGSGNAWRNILTEIVRAAREECKVIIVCSSQNTATAAENYLTSKNVDVSSNIEYLIASNNSIWVRDYGPTSVYENDVDSMLLIDWIYNRDRASDNVVSNFVGQMLNTPVHTTSTAPYDLVNTGGNFMSDGMGQAFASKLVFRNNDQIANGETGGNDIFGTSNHDEAEIDNIMQEFMGIDRYIKMDELPYDGIHHIDMHMKLLDEETLLVGEYPSNTSDGPQIEANIQYVLSQFQTSYGHPFKLVRVPMPSFQGGNYPPYAGASSLYPTYANAVFVNKTIIMPSYNMAMDEAARDTFQKYMPGYKIAQVDCNSIIYSGGAVHCISKEIGVADPLLILHSALPCQDNSYSPGGYEIMAKIQHRSGISSARVFYTTDLHQTWQTIDMQYVTQDTSDVWAVKIPTQLFGSTVYYYIEAVANSGKTFARPITAPEGYWSFCVTQSSAATEPVRVDMEAIYPNPATAITVVPVQVDKKTPAVINLVNVQGRIEETIFSGVLPTCKSQYYFDASKYTPGIYFINIEAGGKHLSQQVIIQ